MSEDIWFVNDFVSDADAATMSLKGGKEFMAVITELEKLIGKSKVSDQAADIAPYLSDMSLMPAGYAEAVAYPESTEDVAAIVKFASENNIPVVPVSSGVHQYGAAIPKEGGIITI
jgi:FAD/FMN-containing dehydrogenase